MVASPARLKTLLQIADLRADLSLQSLSEVRLNCAALREQLQQLEVNPPEGVTDEERLLGEAQRLRYEHWADLRRSALNTQLAAQLALAADRQAEAKTHYGKSIVLRRLTGMPPRKSH